MDQVKIGKFIQTLRKEKGLTQAELASKIGVSDRTISKWENGRGLPDYSYIQNLCNELGITFNEFFSGEKVMKEEKITKLEENLVSSYKEARKSLKQLLTIKKVFIGIGIVIVLLTSLLFYCCHHLHYSFMEVSEFAFSEENRQRTFTAYIPISDTDKQIVSTFLDNLTWDVDGVAGVILDGHIIRINNFQKICIPGDSPYIIIKTFGIKSYGHLTEEEVEQIRSILLRYTIAISGTVDDDLWGD